MRYSELFENMQSDDLDPNQIWYHGTPSDFTEFSNAYTSGQLGVHLGTKEQAMWRLGDENGYILCAKISATNFLRLEDHGSWYGETFIEQLKNNPNTAHLKLHGSMSDRTIRQQLSRLGYDGIVYLNMLEGEDHEDSIIIFDANDTKIVGRYSYNGENESVNLIDNKSLEDNDPDGKGKEVPASAFDTDNA